MKTFGTVVVALGGLLGVVSMLGCPGVDDADEDGWSPKGNPPDCDDNNEYVYPGADEDCDGIPDNNCDGEEDPEDRDDDLDEWTECQGDCDDAESARFPGNDEICDGLDNDCSDEDPGGGEDQDADGYLNCNEGLPEDWDCNDEDPAINPGASESDACEDDKDNDCDELTDGEDDDCGVDADGDGYTDLEDDCDDTDATVHPGAEEICDGLDNDCDEEVPADEADGDGDGYMVCEDDCADADATSYPGAPEICDGLDNDCDDDVPADEEDDDGDGFMECEGDCDDADAARYPGNPEICDGIDNDCDEVVPDDEADGDVDGYMVCQSDCDDTNADVNPGATEVCDGVEDNDCDGIQDTDELDDDGDGYSECEEDCDDTDASLNLDDTDNDGVDSCSGDCDDNDWSIGPNEDEICDGIDNDCDVATDENGDSDGDGYSICDGDCNDDDADDNLLDGDADGHHTCGDDGVADSGDEDCDDSNPAANPDADEVCDGADNDCDEEIDEDEAIDVVTWYRDGDLDGFGNDNVTDEDCDQPAGYVVEAGDCDDTDPNTHPGADEVCDGVDNDCDELFPLDEEDDDGDGWSECEGDCDDTDAAMDLTDVDSDGYNTCDGDCDDADADMHPGLWDADGDGIDWNCDGLDATSLSTADASFVGEASNDFAGDPVCSAGDVDGDGLSDILVGAPYYGASQSGRTYLLFGSTVSGGGTLRLWEADAIFTGEAADDYSGRAVAAAGDVDNDGLDDILIGAYLNDDGGDGAGKTYLVFGATAQSGGQFDLASADVALVGELAQDQSGTAVAGGMVDGDDFSDVLVGAPYNDEVGDMAGKTYLVSGTTVSGGGSFSLTSASTVFLGETAGDQSGTQVACNGDVNGDGLSDILIAANSNDEGGDDAGKTYLVFSDGIQGGGTFSLASASATFVGESEYNYSGSSISLAGDVDGDGLYDILIGAPCNDEIAITAGKTYLMFGATVQSGGDFDLALADATFLGEMEADWSGFSTSSGGDIDADGFADILISAHSNDDAGFGAGKTYLLFGVTVAGGGDFSLASADVAFLGETESDHAGDSVSIVGDVNGDGLDDVVIGATSSDEELYRTGKTYLLFSPY